MARFYKAVSTQEQGVRVENHVIIGKVPSERVFSDIFRSLSF
jgi:hypothetical protein